MTEAQRDAYLCARYRAGDSQAAESLLGKYRFLVLLYTRAYFSPGADRDDFIIEGMVGLFKAVRDFRPRNDCAFAAFADVCIRRQMITGLRSLTGRRQHHLNHAQSLDRLDARQDSDKETTREPIDPAPTPEEAVITHFDSARILHNALSIGSEFEQRVSHLRGRGLSYRAITEALGCNPKSVDNALCRTRRRFETVRAEVDA